MGNPPHSLENDLLQVMLMSHTPPREVAILVFSIAISLCDLQVENQGFFGEISTKLLFDGSEIPFPNHQPHLRKFQQQQKSPRLLAGLLGHV